MGIFGKVWNWLASVEEQFYNSQMEWLAVTHGMYLNHIKSETEISGSEQERVKVWKAIFTAGEWDEDDWKEIFEIESNKYEAYVRNIEVVRQVLRELELNEAQVNGLITALITNPNATTPERLDKFITNWFTLTKQMTGMTDEDLNSMANGSAVGTAIKSLKIQLHSEVMKWIIPDHSEDLRENLAELTLSNITSESAVNMMSVCNVKGYTQEEEYLEPVRTLEKPVTAVKSSIAKELQEKLQRDRSRVKSQKKTAVLEV